MYRTFKSGKKWRDMENSINSKPLGILAIIAIVGESLLLAVIVFLIVFKLIK